jgi:hypothetical protein
MTSASVVLTKELRSTTDCNVVARWAPYVTDEPALSPVTCLSFACPRGISMSDAMSCAEFGNQSIELLPARTVLSLFTADPLGGGEAGKAGANGQGMHGLSFLGMFGWGGSDPAPSTTDPGSQA